MIENQEHSKIELGSNRSFGIVFCVVFAIIGLYPLIGGSDIRVWSLSLAAIFLTISLLLPQLFTPLNKLWFKFGLLLGRIVNPIVMFLIYITSVVPIGLIMRGFGKDPLSRKFDAGSNSYWINRDPAGPEPDSLTDQF